VALTAICLVLVISIVVYSFPFIVGADSSYTVMSGSMSPALIPGDLIIVKGEDPISIGDIVTYNAGEFTVTHRVFEKLEGERFVLKGDANEDPDQGIVEASQIVGKVVMVFPFSHLYTPVGFVLALLVPAGLIIGNQMITVYQQMKSRNKKETMFWRRKQNRNISISTSTLLLALILTVSTSRLIAPSFTTGSSSYFSDVERFTGFFRTGIWHIDVSVDIKPDTLNIDSKGEWITVYALIDTQYDEKEIDVSSVKINGEIMAVRGELIDNQLMVKFDRISVIELFPEGIDEITLTVTGKFTDGVSFSGEDTIKVVNHEGK